MERGREVGEPLESAAVAPLVRRYVTGSADSAAYSVLRDVQPGTWYQEMIVVAAQHVTPENQFRLRWLFDLVQVPPDSETSEYESLGLDWARLVYAGHVVTGRSLLRVLCAGAPAFHVPAHRLESMLDWRQFVSDPARRAEHVDHLALSPVPPLFRVTALDIIRTMTRGNLNALGNSITSAVSQLTRLDAAGGYEMTDLMVSCLAPPNVPSPVTGVS